MPQPAVLQKAEMQAITWDGDVVRELEHNLSVQFNPETLKISFANQTSGGDQSGGAATQFVAQGTTKLVFDLWFDVTAPEPDQSEESDVRKLTEKIAFFMRPHEEVGEGAPPGVRFLWGSFLFEGIMDSLNETLEYFSEQGRPLRAGLAVSLSQQEIQFRFGDQQSPGLGSNASPGATPRDQARAGDTLQDIAARQGRPEDWQNIALANGIENPRMLTPGESINFKV